MFGYTITECYSEGVGRLIVQTFLWSRILLSKYLRRRRKQRDFSKGARPGWLDTAV